MKRIRKHEIGKSRVTQITREDVGTCTVIGIIALWVVWVSTSLLIHFFK
ncbi:MAG: hypothetical protein R3297_06800 [Desulfobulbales bacterium]|nr:hypothetical protein [Desulfobulbales bacterium]